MANFILNTGTDSMKILEKFNFFHDGFIKELRLLCHDAFDENKNLIYSGKNDLEIKFAHFNYDEGKQPFNRIVISYFKDVIDVNIDFRDFKIGDGSINEVNFQKIKVKKNEKEEECFICIIIDSCINNVLFMAK